MHWIIAATANTLFINILLSEQVESLKGWKDHGKGMKIVNIH